MEKVDPCARSGVIFLVHVDYPKYLAQMAYMLLLFTTECVLFSSMQQFNIFDVVVLCANILGAFCDVVLC